MTKPPRDPLRDLSAHYGAGTERITLTHDEVGEIIDALNAKESLLQRQHKALVALREIDGGFMPRGTSRQWLWLAFWVAVGVLLGRLIA